MPTIYPRTHFYIFAFSKECGLYKFSVAGIWMKLFPDDNNMPARHSHLASLDGDCIMQIVFTAVVSS